MNFLSKTLVQRIRTCGVKQKALAEKLGVTPVMLSGWMSGRRVSHERAVALAALVGVAPEEACASKPALIRTRVPRPRRVCPRPN